MAIYNPRRKAWNESFPDRPHKEPTLPILDFRLLASKTETIHVCCLMHSSCGPLLQQPLELLYFAKYLHFVCDLVICLHFMGKIHKEKSSIYENTWHEARKQKAT